MRGKTARLAGGVAPVHPDQEGQALTGPPFSPAREPLSTPQAASADALTGGIKPARPRRHGSEKRERSNVLGVRLTKDERARIDGQAERAGLTTGSYARSVLLGAPAPRQVRRPPVERRELARLLGELGHVGANLNQLAHNSNAGLPVRRHELFEALGGLRIVRDAILEALGRVK